jgi:predicted HTH domain antitoxin
MTLINIDLSDDDIDEIEAVAELLGTDDEAVIRKALCEGLAEIRLDHAIRRYQAGEMTVNQAARIADLALADWLVVAREHGLTTQLTPADLAADAADRP